jgi:hypothetical protein
MYVKQKYFTFSLANGGDAALETAINTWLSEIQAKPADASNCRRTTPRNLDLKVVGPTTLLATAIAGTE